MWWVEGWMKNQIGEAHIPAKHVCYTSLNRKNVCLDKPWKFYQIWKKYKNVFFQPSVNPHPTPSASHSIQMFLNHCACGLQNHAAKPTSKAFGQVVYSPTWSQALKKHTHFFGTCNFALSGPVQAVHRSLPIDSRMSVLVGSCGRQTREKHCQIRMHWCRHPRLFLISAAQGHTHLDSPTICQCTVCQNREILL